MLIACRDMSKIKVLKRMLNRVFDMKNLGAAKKILEMETKIERKNR